MRMCLSELNRIHSHLVWLGTSALEIGAISMFWYAFRERDMVLDLFEMVTGVRMHTRYFQVGGLAEDIPEGFYAAGAGLRARTCRGRSNDYEALLDRNKIWLERTKGIGLLSAADALALGQSGPDAARAPASTGTSARRAVPRLRRGRLRRPRLPERRRLRPLQGAHGRDARSRRASSPSASTGSRSCAGEPWIADDRKVVLPPREELHTSMESLIHHFKIVTEGYRVPEGEVYVAIESRARRVRLLPRLGRRPEAVAREVPGAELRRAAGDGDLRARHRDRRPDRRRRRRSTP